MRLRSRRAQARRACPRAARRAQAQDDRDDPGRRRAAHLGHRGAGRGRRAVDRLGSRRAQGPRPAARSALRAAFRVGRPARRPRPGVQLGRRRQARWHRRRGAAPRPPPLPPRHPRGVDRPCRRRQARHRGLEPRPRRAAHHAVRERQPRISSIPPRPNLATAAALQLVVHVRGRGGEPARLSLPTPAAVIANAHWDNRAGPALAPESEEGEAPAGTRSTPTPHPQSSKTITAGAGSAGRPEWVVGSAEETPSAIAHGGCAWFRVGAYFALYPRRARSVSRRTPRSPTGLGKRLVTLVTTTPPYGRGPWT